MGKTHPPLLSAWGKASLYPQPGRCQPRLSVRVTLLAPYSLTIICYSKQMPGQINKSALLRCKLTWLNFSEIVGAGEATPDILPPGDGFANGQGWCNRTVLVAISG